MLSSEEWSRRVGGYNKWVVMSVSSSTVGGGRTKYKIIFLGDQSVGKSSIIEKYIKDRFE